MSTLMASYSITQKGKDLLKAKEILHPEVQNFLENLEAETGPEWFNVPAASVSQLVRYNYIKRLALPEDYVYPKRRY